MNCFQCFYFLAEFGLVFRFMVKVYVYTSGVRLKFTV